MILRDLVVLTICIGRGPWDNASLELALHDAVAQGHKGHELDKVLWSQLSLAFNKVIKLGADRKGFDVHVLSNNMYGPSLTGDEVGRLFVAYSTCSREMQTM